MPPVAETWTTPRIKPPPPPPVHISHSDHALVGRAEWKAMDIIYEISTLLNTGLNKDAGGVRMSPGPGLLRFELFLVTVLVFQTIVRFDPGFLPVSVPVFEICSSLCGARPIGLVWVPILAY